VPAHEAPKLVHLVRATGLDVMKCLEKDRGRRYKTANGLAQDLERHLNHEPVTAAARARDTEWRSLSAAIALASQSPLPRGSRGRRGDGKRLAGGARDPAERQARTVAAFMKTCSTACGHPARWTGHENAPRDLGHNRQQPRKRPQESPAVAAELRSTLGRSIWTSGIHEAEPCTVARWLLESRYSVINTRVRPNPRRPRR